MKNTDTGILLQKIAANDDHCFSVLYRAYHQKIRIQVDRYSTKVLVQEDLVQEVFMKLWTKRFHLGAIQNFDGWIVLFTRNVVLDYLRKERKEQIGWENYCKEFMQFYPPCEDNYYMRHVEKTYQQMVHSLPLRQKQAFILSRELNFSRKEIAALMQVSENTVKFNLKAARQKLRNWYLTHLS